MAKEVILGEHDELWGELRHLHIAQASAEVNEKMEEFRKKNVAARLGVGILGLLNVVNQNTAVVTSLVSTPIHYLDDMVCVQNLMLAQK